MSKGFRTCEGVAQITAMLLLAGAARLLCGQQAAAGLSVQALGPDGRGVAGAYVEIHATLDEDATWHCTTRDDGFCSLPGVEAGSYVLTVAATGFATAKDALFLAGDKPFQRSVSLQKSSTNKQTADGNKVPEAKGALAFQQAATHGSTAPMGYSTGLSNEESAAIALQLQHGAAEIYADLPVAADTHSKRLATQATHSLQQGDTQQAAKAFSLLPEAVQSSAAGLRFRAMIFIRTGQRAEAQKVFLQAWQKDSSTSNLYRCGVGFLEAGQPEQALILLKDAIASYPKDARLRLGFGYAEAEAGDLQSAKAALQDAAKLRPGWLTPLLALSEFQDLSLGELEEIKAALFTELQSHPQSTEALIATMRVLQRLAAARQNDLLLDEALKLYAEALPNLTENASLHFLRGEILQEKHRLPEAVLAYRAGLQLAPANRKAHYQLSLLLHQLGLEAEAQGEMKIFRQLPKDVVAEKN